MPRLSEIYYSREECISAVRGYYNFLTNMYLDEPDVIEPPAEGWPDITTSTMQGLGKTDEVISLLRRLPYIREPDNDMDWAQSAGYSYFADWQDIGRLLSRDPSQAEPRKVASESASLFEVIPPHVIGLTHRSREVFLLDTELGIVLWYECPGEIRHSPSRERVEDDPYDYEEDEAQAEWRGECTAWAVSGFFEMLKDQFRELQFIPLNHRVVVDVYTRLWPGSAGMRELVQSVYKEHGWPDTGRYRKEDCLKAIQKALEEHYPDDASI
ncbi:uncharacterized protein Triagg1_9470 [Trichoderma aggressivum f. europaeum]|uniref:Uncharacterized protein n=1 Tax=Trichoderma aggressivum f. europaeum TaxID=173218 RepID=A0AAE1I8M5_9HYPO|nr:hypothetical protein Triagg1_9470 [Trichoderma aggressivum f. europaeum]